MSNFMKFRQEDTSCNLADRRTARYFEAKSRFS